jgi:Zn-dependent protease with chaperone function
VSVPPEYLGRATRRLERWNRLRILSGIAALIGLSIAPLLAHHVVGASDSLTRLDHLGALCLTALHYLLTPLLGAFYVILAVGVAVAVHDRVMACIRLRAVLAALPQAAPGADETFARAAREAGVDPRILRVAPHLPNPAFTAGLLSPRIYLARELERRLTYQQLVAVIAHEGVHARRRDPLRLTVIRFIARTLFWLPALDQLAKDLADEIEVRADDAATGRTPLALAAALVTIASGTRLAAPEAAIGACSGDQPDLLERRVRRLAGEDGAVRSHITCRSKLLGIAAAGALLLTSLPAVHPVAATSDHEHSHCLHERESPLSHLFCRNSAPAQEHCPHGTDHQPA